MNNYRRFACISIAAGIIMLLICNVIYVIVNGDNKKYYAVEVSRVVSELREKNSIHSTINSESAIDGSDKNSRDNISKDKGNKSYISKDYMESDIYAEKHDGDKNNDENDNKNNDKKIIDADISGYKYITRVSVYSPDEICNSEYAVEEVDGVLYRIEYDQDQGNDTLLYMNIAAGAMLLYIIIIILYIGKKIVKPFGNMNMLTAELAKGNLATPIKEEKSRYMGRFLWGLDMLRENLEDAKEKEIELQREKKELILSISHDIKTPLAAIELYSKALSENMYDDEKKREQALAGIANNTKMIKKYIDDIISASREDFINMDVKMSEFYLSELIDSIRKYYTEKLGLLHTEFIIEKMPDCLLKGDFDRVTEVFQNIIENAIKYGDGKRISLSSFEEEDCRIILVENTGNTLKNEELTNIFDSFYRGSNSKGIKGSGLGLYICRKLMKNMDGDIYTGTDDGKFMVGVVLRKV